ncbi:hypothetical protein K3495_g9293 [Podosphaera aphanis]|nr:hypothetical protein K3495_g9293 [Podosphaera aphanis]
MIYQRLLVILGFFLCVVVKGVELSPGVIPACPLKCLREVVSASTCDQADIECKCNNPEIYEKTTTCVLKNCSLSHGVLLSKVQAEICHRPQQSRQDVIRMSLIGPAIIVTITSILRYISCWKVRGGLFLEDYLIFVAILMYWVLQSLIFRIVDLGFGTHVYQLNPELVGQILKLFFIAENLYAVEVIVIKVSLCCFFLRIFPQRIFRICCYSLIIYMAILAAVWVLLLVFQCKPITSNWNINIEHPRCYNIQIYSYVGAAAAMSQDACILALPIPLVLQLKISTRKKIGVIIMFSLGIFVTITSAIRTKAIKYLGASGDPSWDNIDITIWTSMEISVGLICCNMPAIASIITHIRRKVFSSSRSGSVTPSEPKLSINSSTDHKTTPRAWYRSGGPRASVNCSKRIPSICTRKYPNPDLERGNFRMGKEIESRDNSSSDSEKWLKDSSWLDIHSSDPQKELPIPPSVTLATYRQDFEDKSEELGKYSNKRSDGNFISINSPLSLPQNLGSGIMVRKDFTVEEAVIEDTTSQPIKRDALELPSEKKENFTERASVDIFHVEERITGPPQDQSSRVIPISIRTQSSHHQQYRHDESLDLLVYETFFTP